VIPKAHIVAWRQFAPWVSDAQVEQDLIISRALVAIFENDILAKQLSFRGGTALHKLYCKPASRYSEDIDLVQITAGPIGTILDALQETLNIFLGVPRRKQTEDAVTLHYRMESEGPPFVPMKLKVEINTREHEAYLGLKKKPFSVESRWYNGTCKITTFRLEELLATKVRALYQRRKGRDLFDIWLALMESEANAAMVVETFKKYMEAEDNKVTRKDFEKNLKDKMEHPGFSSDLKPLLSAKVNYDDKKAFELVCKEIVSRI